MENLISYLKEQKIDFKQVGENVVIINDNSYELIKPDEDGRLFTEDFILITDNTDCDNYIFSFGGKWYSVLNGLEDKPKLNEIKYIGKSYEEFETKCFLGVRGEFEILNGTSNYRDWCRKAKFLGIEYLGICEKNTLAGIIKFQENCKKFNIKPIIGATYTVQKSDDLKYDLKFYVKNEVGWNNLLQINKEVNCTNNSRLIEESVLKNFIEGLFIIIDPKSIEYNLVPLWIKRDCYYQLDTVEFESEEKDTWYLNNLKLFKNSNLKPVSITDAYYLDKEYSYIKLLLNEVSGVRDYKSSNQYFKSKSDYFNELSLLFNQYDENFYDIYQEAVNNELFISKICSEFNIQTGSRHLPIYERIGDELKFDSNEDLFWSLIEQGLSKLGSDKDINLYINRVNKEFDVIEKGGVIDYFLMLHDIVSWCKNKDILVGIGRGSAGGSLVSMLLGLIHLDPIEFDLLFERFLNEGRIKVSLPDIDTDIEALRRNEVKNYIENRFGISQVISIGTYTCLQLKAAIKDLCRVYNVSFEESNYITSLFDEHQNSIDELFKLAARNETIKKFLNSYPELINTLSVVLGSPKAKSVHACAMVIFPKEKDMYSWAPIMKQGDLLVSEWEGGEMEKVGFLKEDILGIKQLDKFRNIINLIEKNTGKKIDIYSIPFDDKNVYKFFKKGYNGDCFHFGSKGLTGYCKELKPENIDDLIAGISLYRPGAMENNFHNEYVLRKSGEHDVEYSIGTESILNTTYGVFVYQEQIMKLCQVLGGLSLVEADDVRKAMVKKTYEELTKYRERFIPYYVENFNVSLDYATNVWDQIDKASTYIFNKSHATAYAITGYISQWFKVNYPIYYWSTAFTFLSQEDIKNGKISLFISEINKTGDIKVAPPDINNSASETTSNFQLNTIYWGLISVRQCGEIAVSQVIEERDKNGKYFSLDEFLERHTFKGSKVNKSVVENLILSGAFDEIEEVKYPSERMRLINYYRDKNKVKPDKERDLFIVNKGSIKEDYWWSLQQKRMSGLSFFDYQDLCDKYIGGRYIDQQEYQSESLHYTTQYSTGGYISEVIERTSKKGKYCSLYIESNYFFLWTTIFPEQYKLFIDNGINLVEEKSSIILLSGNIVKDTYKKENVMRLNSESQFLILK